jgi:drug/metabolite transporter (DMT)-like permease
MRTTTLNRFSPVTLLVWTSLFWAGNMVVGRAVAGAMSPLALSCWRWAIAVAVLAPFCWRQVVKQRRALLRSWRIMLLLGVMSTALYNSLTYWALHYTTATNTALLNSTIPIWVMMASWILLRESPSARSLMGFTISLAGVLCIVSRGQPGVLLTLAPNPGDLIMVGALIIWGFYAVLLRYRPPTLPPLAYIFVTGCIGLIVAAPFLIVERRYFPTESLSPAAVAAVVYFAVFPTVAATLFYNSAVDRIGPVSASLYIHLVPLFGSLLAMLFLSERPGWQHLAGVALVLLGIVLSRRASVAPPRDARHDEERSRQPARRAATRPTDRVHPPVASTNRID